MLIWAPRCSQLLSPSQPTVTQPLGSSGRISRGRDDHLPVVIRTQGESGVACQGTAVNGERRLILCWVQAGGQAGLCVQSWAVWHGYLASWVGWKGQKQGMEQENWHMGQLSLELE